MQTEEDRENVEKEERMKAEKAKKNKAIVEKKDTHDANEATSIYEIFDHDS